MTLLDILKPNQSRKLVVFGTASLAEKVYSWLSEFKVEFFIDNNASKWGDTFLGVDIKSPEALLTEPKGTYLILIASSYVAEIEEQLQSMGFLLKEDMVDCNYIAYNAEGEFYSPLPSIKDVRTKTRLPKKLPTSIAGIDFNESEQLLLLQEFSTYKALYPYSNNKEPQKFRYPSSYNPFFDFPDAMNLFCMMNKLRPKKIIEVGSGYSSALMLDINEHFLESEVELSFIEPYPERLYSLLSERDRKQVRIYEKNLQEVDLGCFEQLEDGDILFIDSSHVVKFDSDVNLLFSHIIPCLKKGVIIHFHDIQYPFEYPDNWLYEGRSWNEAYMLRSFLQFNDVFKIIFWNSYLTQQHEDTLNIDFSDFHGGGSIWIRKEK